MTKEVEDGQVEILTPIDEQEYVHRVMDMIHGYLNEANELQEVLKTVEEMMDRGFIVRFYRGEDDRLIYKVFKKPPMGFIQNGD